MQSIENLPLLSSIIFSPLLGALLLLLFKSDNDDSKDLIKKWAFLFTLIPFLLSIILLCKFDNTVSVFQFEENISWITTFNINYHIGIDGISIFLILLTSVLTPICILSSSSSINERTKLFMVIFLMLESFVMGVFAALDLVLFYVFFEAMLIPMFLIIGIWGGEHRVYAAFKFFLYTMAGSVLFLLALIYLYNQIGSFDINDLYQQGPKLSLEVQKYLWLAFFAAFAVKVPMWPVHTWLPDAHVQAPTAGSVILAGILLKIGGYGFLRFSIPMLPDASFYYADFVKILSCIAIIYASFVALMQKDMKKLIAYSSIAHMGYVTLALFVFNKISYEGAIVHMLSHGLVSSALFLCVGVLYDRMHTKEIAKYGGVADKMPIFAAIFMFFTMASVGLPTTSGFVGEFLVLLGVYQGAKISAALAATGLVLGAAYMLWLYKRVMFGEVLNPEISKLGDVSAREFMIFLPLVLLVLILGIYPKFITDNIGHSVTNLLTQINIR